MLKLYKGYKKFKIYNHRVKLFIIYVSSKYERLPDLYVTTQEIPKVYIVQTTTSRSLSLKMHAMSQNWDLYMFIKAACLV